MNELNTCSTCSHNAVCAHKTQYEKYCEHIMAAKAEQMGQMPVGAEALFEVTVKCNHYALYKPMFGTRGPVGKNEDLDNGVPIRSHDHLYNKGGD